ncbi:MAG: SusD/RagB family nutrient-binding outer membrane lipoprotein [Dysgonamonadaceae bacterium]|nr:SusD/RagB family nutrient-binding outer membrane lipoprotein [Dysgonamonadaceae bacterium]
MKKYFIKIALAGALLWVIFGFSACNLDINENPNSATGSVVTPDLILSPTVASTVYNQIYYYGYASAAYYAGFQVPGDGIAGFGEQYSYNLTSSSVTGAWTEIFANLRQYKTIIQKSEEDPKYALFGGIAHILKAYSYQLLVDAYGDVPYTEGLGGKTGNYTPKYDKDSEVYQLLVGELDEAIAILKENQGKIGAGVTALNSISDPLFGGDITQWIRLANNVKLRLLVRAEGTTIDAFVKEAFGKFSSEGFLKENALVNPGYSPSTIDRQNPYWNVYHSSTAGTITQSANYYIPSRYVFSFYNGAKLTDEFRGKLVYKGFPNTPSGQLGQEAKGSPDHPASTKYVWFIGTGTNAAASQDNAGILKSRSAGAPLFTAAEAYFLLAEAALNGHVLDGDALSNFDKGIEASFAYLALKGTETALPDVRAEVAAYKAANSDNWLVNFELATNNAQKLEAIITQKYIALNIVNSNEAWNEFRRTAYPRISGTDPAHTFVSIQSASTHSDKLPVRLVYPQTEIDLNGNNVPAKRNPYSDLIFWDKD